jgi:hypothetical protein
MPPPSPSVSPKPFSVSSKFQSRPNYPDQEDVFYTPENKQDKDKGKERAALGLIDTNQNQATASGSGSTSKVPTVYHTSIPKPPLLPDVFTPHGQKRVNDENDGEERPRKRTTTTTTTTNDTTTGNNVARARDMKAARKDVEVEQEKWRMKWIKSFPTLTFHFEVEADQGLGKALKARAIKMGAVSHIAFCEVVLI